MGKFAQPLLVIAGTIIGAYFGNPELGALIGGIAGQLLFPTKLPTQVGPRLSDTAATQSNVGAAIPKGWGTFPASGCIIIQTDLVETIDSETVGGKGGPQQTTDTPQYHQTFAIGINDGEIDGIRVIWANGKPIYDRRPQGGTETGGPHESDTAFTARMAASDQTEAGFTIYKGTETQLADPTLEAFYGVGNISAFRGLAYIVFHNWLNKAEDGNRMPSQWKFEVFGDGDRTGETPYEYSAGQFIPWSEGRDPRSDGMIVGYSVVADVNIQPFFQGEYSTLAEVIVHVDEMINIESVSTPTLHFNTDWQAGAPSCNILQGCMGDPVGYVSLGGAAVFLDRNGGDDMSDFSNREKNFAYMAFNAFDGGDLCVTDLSIPGLIAHAPHNEPIRYDNGHVSGVLMRVETHGAAFTHAAGYSSGDQDLLDGTTVCSSKNHFVRVNRVWQAPEDPCKDRPDVPGASDYCVSAAGKITLRGPWQFVDTSPLAGFLVLRQAQSVIDANGIKQQFDPGSGPILQDLFDPNNNETFWTNAYLSALAVGYVPSGLIYGVDYPVLTPFTYRRPAVATGTVTTGEALLTTILGEICGEAGLAGLTDASGLAGILVHGYIRSGVMAARAAILPLSMAYNFDGVESNGKIVFRARGNDVVWTIADDDMGAQDEANSDAGTKPSKLKVTQTQDTDLPAQVRVHYLSAARDYEVGEQDSPMRFDTQAVQISDVEMPIVLTDDQAMQIAQSLWAQAWRERVGYATTVEGGLQGLEPADAVALPVDGRTERARIISITDSLPSTRQLALVADDEFSYKSYAVSNSSVPIPSPVLSITLPADAWFLDIPLLRESDNDAGFYVAPFGTIWTDFAGAGIYRSVDGGGSYGKIGVSAAPSCTIGNVRLPLMGVGPFDIFDEKSVLTVELIGGALFNATEAAVIAGSNAAAIGVDGRWEIIQFKRAVHVSGKLYQISGLLRGRRGTEWAIGTSQNGDKFVMLEGVVRVPLDSTLINNSYNYKIVGTGNLIEGTGSQLFTGHAVALKPFAGVDASGKINPSSHDWSITWVRRGRIGQAIQNGAEIALSEGSEAYQIDIYDGSDIVRTLTSLTTTVSYLSTQQVTDFGGNQTTLKVAIYQMSTVVGRGYPLNATITP